MTEGGLTIKMKYRFGDIVTHKLGSEPMLVVSLQINKDRVYSYGCSDKDGNWKWFKEYELKKEKEKKIKGFIVKLNS